MKCNIYVLKNRKIYVYFNGIGYRLDLENNMLKYNISNPEEWMLIDRLVKFQTSLEVEKDSILSIKELLPELWL